MTNTSTSTGAIDSIISNEPTTVMTPVTSCRISLDSEVLIVSMS